MKKIILLILGIIVTIVATCQTFDINSKGIRLIPSIGNFNNSLDAPSVGSLRFGIPLGGTVRELLAGGTQTNIDWQITPKGSGGFIVPAASVTQDDALTRVLAINSSTGKFFWRDASSISGVTNLSYTAATRLLSSSTGTDVTLPLFTSTDAGLTPLSGGGSTNFLRADGTWAAPISGTGWNLSGRTKLTGSAYVYPLSSVDEIFIGSNFNQDSLASSVRILSNTLTQIGGATSFVTADGSGVDIVSDGSDLIQIRSGGSTIIQTASTERLEIENDGAWQLGGVTGSSGQVLTSNGSSSSPSWQTPILLTTTVSINNANFLTLDTSPITLIAAQGAGTFVNILSAHLELSGNASPTAFNISDNLLIRTNTNEGTDNGIFEMDDGTINQSGLTAPRTYRFMPMDGGVALQGSTPLNTAMLLGVKNGGSISAGNQTVRIRLVYTVETY